MNLAMYIFWVFFDKYHIKLPHPLSQNVQPTDLFFYNKHMVLKECQIQFKI
jgi:hypothetical protein